MPTIRDLVSALSRREGVDAVVVVGRDGLPIDADSQAGVDSESVAALLPAITTGIQQFGHAAGRGDFGTGVMEYGNGLAVVSVLSPEATLVVLVRPSSNVGGLLFDLRRHHPALAGLV